MVVLMVAEMTEAAPGGPRWVYWVESRAAVLIVLPMVSEMNEAMMVEAAVVSRVA